MGQSRRFFRCKGGLNERTSRTMRGHFLVLTRSCDEFPVKGGRRTPFMLTIAVWSTIRDAMSSLAGHRLQWNLNAPMTAEGIPMSLRILLN
jgi:hypothetical protein